jgi:beta-aspartyl-dipeptidase (metallo-type)
MGGNIDFTVEGQELSFPLTTGKALKMALDGGVSIEQITLSSDSNGSMPVFDERGKLTKLAVGEIQNLLCPISLCALLVESTTAAPLAG